MQSSLFYDSLLLLNVLIKMAYKKGGDMTEKQDKLMDLIAINVEVGWKCDFRCEDCYRFFECPSPHKQDFRNSLRMETITENLSSVRHIIAVMSGKGGVGKSIISANMAVALADRRYTVAIIDSDLCGPSIPSILGVGGRLKSGPRGIIPPQGVLGIKIVSMAFLLGDENAVTWLNDLKRGAQELFLANVDYGYLDYLIIDMPPGTGSEVVNLFKYLPQITGAVMITIPSDVAEQVVRRAVSLCQKADVPIIGMIENMNGFICPHCGKIYGPGYGSGEILSEEAGVPLLGKIARDQLIVNAADQGNSFLLKYPDEEVSKNFIGIVNRIEEKVGGNNRPESLVETHRIPEEGPIMEIVEINVGDSCYGESCYSCNKYFECTRPGKKNEIYVNRRLRRIKEAMSGIRYKIAIMSCKGGVGKSTLAANIAAELASRGKRTTILDCDFHGPCIPKILGAEGESLKIGEKGIVPVWGSLNVGVISVAFLLQLSESVTWFDTLKKATVEQLLSGVDYGSLDYLIIDLPPGTGAESYGLLQYTPDLDGTLVITLPSENPQAVSRRSINLCRQAEVPVIGIIENMSGFVCSDCNNTWEMCGTKKSEEVAEEIGVPFLGDIPIDNQILESYSERLPFVIKNPESAAAQSLRRIVDKIQDALQDDST